MKKIDKNTRHILKVMKRIDDTTFKEGAFVAAVACCALLPTLADRMTRKERKRLPMLLTLAREETLSKTLDETTSA
jgi:hypothetical protein